MHLQEYIYILIFDLDLWSYEKLPSTLYTIMTNALAKFEAATSKALDGDALILQ